MSGCGGEPGEGDPGEGPALKILYAPDRLHTTAPAEFTVRFETSEGEFTVRVVREWAPLGADRFYTLVTNAFFDDTRVQRVAEGFVAQFGLNGDGLVNSAWRNEFIADDPPLQSNTRGRLTFATSGLDSRTTDVFINLGDNSRLDSMGFAPIGEVVEGMEVVDAFYSGYGEGPPQGDGPYYAQALAQGNEYLDAEFPNLTRIVRARVISEG
jgi:peptidyl-prolyl cis-trans isomerase A (cyclophilin A)